MKKAISLLPLMAALALLLGGCARQESTAERDTEIERRVQQRLAEEHAAQEKQELDQRAYALAGRERQLASREAFFATMTASLAQDPTIDPTSDQSGPTNLYANEPASQPSSDGLYYGQSGSVAPASSTFESTQPSLDEPYPYIDPYLFDEPYSYGSSIPYVTIINQNTRLASPSRRRMRPGNMHQEPRMRPAQNPAGGLHPAPRPGGVMRPPTVSQRPRRRAVQPTLNHPTPKRPQVLSRTAPIKQGGRARPQPR